MIITITESGQSLADLALQAYGTIEPEAMFALVEDNKSIFQQGLASLVPAGVPVKVRENAGFANKQISVFFDNRTVNSSYVPGPAIEQEGSSEDTGALSFALCATTVKTVVVHASVEKDNTIYFLQIIILNGERLEHIVSTVTTSNIDLQENINIYALSGIIYLNVSGVDILRYRIISAL